MCIHDGRSREGAWIEIQLYAIPVRFQAVAPVRERGLKFVSLHCNAATPAGRSREGAWIEIALGLDICEPCRLVAPVRERGLKFLQEHLHNYHRQSLP